MLPRNEAGRGSKIGYYLRTDVAATSTGCGPDGSQAVSVKVTMTSTAQANAADLASGNVIPKGEVRTNVPALRPHWGQVDDVRVRSWPPECLLPDPQPPRGRRPHGPAQTG